MTTVERVIQRFGPAGVILGWINSEFLVTAGYGSAPGELSFTCYKIVPPTIDQDPWYVTPTGDKYYSPVIGGTNTAVSSLAEAAPAGYEPVGMIMSETFFARLSDKTALIFIPVYYRRRTFNSNGTSVDEWLASMRVVSMSVPSMDSGFAGFADVEVYLSPNSLTGFVGASGFGDTVFPPPTFDAVDVSRGSLLYNVTPGSTYAFNFGEPDGYLNLLNGPPTVVLPSYTNYLSYIWRDQNGAPMVVGTHVGDVQALNGDFPALGWEGPRAASNLVMVSPVHSPDEVVFVYALAGLNNPLMLARLSMSTGQWGVPIQLANDVAGIYYNLTISRHDFLDAYPGYFHVVREFSQSGSTLRTTQFAKVTHAPGSSSATVGDWVTTSTYDPGVAG